jgi:serine/threonine protein kinase
MDESENQDQQPAPKPKSPTRREIGNPNLFAENIVFSDTEKILFEEDLKDRHKTRDDLMDGNPAERYTPNKKLNQGGMKAIWEVDDHRTARKVAMALIQDSKIASEEDIDSFLYEARLTANLQHPNIIPIYDIAVDENGNPYFTMKALKGETLGEIIRKLSGGHAEYTKLYTRTRLLGVFLKVCNAIDYAHSKGVIHLDLKPSNVVVGDFGDVHVLDWGLSTLITHLDEYDGEPVSWQSIDDVALENGQTLTRYLESSAKRRHVVGGTPGYMSPEQAQGAPSDIDFQTDVYMLGAMLYELLTYQCPVVGATVKEVLQKTVRGELPAPAKRAPERKIPPSLAAIAMKAMHVDPAERYPNVAALIQDIHQFQDGFATVAENPTFITHFALLIRRHKMAVSLLGGSALIIASILVNSYLSIKGALAELKEKNDYIEATAKRVAPDYLELMLRAERSYAFADAEKALDTSLAFDPTDPSAWMNKVHMLMSQRRFSEARNIVTGRNLQISRDIRKLLDTYADKDGLAGNAVSALVGDFLNHGMKDGLPRLFHHLNQESFDPDAHFQTIKTALGLLNPTVKELHFDWRAARSGGWIIDVGDNPGLDDISPLCGLDIASLTADNIGTPDLALLTGKNLRFLALSGSRINHLFDLDQLAGLEELDISDTAIRNIANIVKYPRLATLDLSGIDELAVSPQLVWCRNLKLLTIAETFRNDPTVQTLARRGVIIIYTDH